MSPGTSKQVLSPWLQMVYRPRRTIRRIVDNDPKRLLTPLAALTGVSTMLGQFLSSNAGDHLIFPLLLIIVIMGGPLLGIVLNRWIGQLLHGTSSKLGGRGTVDAARAAYAWSFIPSIWALLLWIPAIAAFGPVLFRSDVPRIGTDAGRSLMYFGFFAVQSIAGIWSVILLVASVSEVEEISVWRALVALLITGLVLFGVLFVIGLVL